MQNLKKKKKRNKISVIDKTTQQARCDITGWEPGASLRHSGRVGENQQQKEMLEF